MQTTAEQTDEKSSGRSSEPAAQIFKWAIVLLAGLGILLLPRPEAVTPQSWRLLAIFVATIVATILRPLPIGATVLIGVIVLVVSGALPLNQALAGYSDASVWMVFGAFFLSRGMIKTGLGLRIAFLFIRAIGRHALGLAYALTATGALLASVIPSTTARTGGILLPIATGIAEAFDSRPGDSKPGDLQPGSSARRLGAFLMAMLYQSEVVICTMFLTSAASSPMIAQFAKQITGIELSYSLWALTACVPALVSLVVIPWLIFRLFPPEIKHTPEAARMAEAELAKLGSFSTGEKITAAVFVLVAALWMTKNWHGLDYAIVAFIGVAVLLLTRIISWDDMLAERGAWDVFIWYGGLLMMGKALGDSGVTKKFAELAASFAAGWHWWAALAGLLLVYFYAHYGFASISSHVTAMFIPFLTVVLAAGAPPFLAVLALSSCSNLSASLTHYGTTSGAIYFGAGYVSQREWWRLGFIASVVNILIWSVVGLLWWKVLRLW